MKKASPNILLLRDADSTEAAVFLVQGRAERTEFSKRNRRANSMSGEQTLEQGKRPSPPKDKVKGKDFTKDPQPLDYKTPPCVAIPRSWYRAQKPSSTGIRKKYEKITKSPNPGRAPKIRKKYRKNIKMAQKSPFS